MDALGRIAAVAHAPHHQGGAAHDVAAREHAAANPRQDYERPNRRPREDRE